MSAQVRAGDVIRYEPKSTWCHDGYAIARTRRDGSVALYETYWSSGGDDNIVAPEAYEVLFNLDDYEEKPPYVWETFAPADRQYIPKHSGYHTIHLVRKGAKPDLTTQIENAHERLAEAEHAVRAAEHNRDWRRSELAGAVCRGRAVTPNLVRFGRQRLAAVPNPEPPACNTDTHGGFCVMNEGHRGRHLPWPANYSPTRLDLEDAS